ncbi:glucose-6-phosphate isomerase [Luteimonas vadosa]|uniref:Glucose-6-phosphate isomerase n=1 Tax=Luteimonas vadosa TaxID=1165507 RepID=A0ABP9E291_9GAMM
MAAWLEPLHAQARRMGNATLRGLVDDDPARAGDFSLRVGPIHANFARQRMDREALGALLGVAGDMALPVAMRALFDGATVNVSEQRPALHTALRSGLGQGEIATRARGQARAAHERMADSIATLEASEVTDIVNVGIGGSDLGPRLSVDALKDWRTGRFRLHFVGNVDASEAGHVLDGLDPRRTAVVLVSKSFGTQETLLNGAILRDWLGSGDRMHAVSANVAAAVAFGIDPGRVLPMWDWVGGRYSLWSTVGFSIAAAIGMQGFDGFLGGAAEMDAHALESPVEANLPLRHALTAVWNRNILGLPTQAVLPYDQRLALFPAYLQQLVMESLGKSVRTDGSPVATATVPVLWGGAGTNAQHSFFQALHQGTDVVPADFIGVVHPAHGHSGSHAVLLANLLAQSEALANGCADGDPQKAYPGNRPSTVLLLDALTPRSLGALIALYEHSVYLQATMWGINAFDQWGVELGKRIAGDLLPAVSGKGEARDPVTRALLAEIHGHG